jgi:hypothetical protein
MKAQFAVALFLLAPALVALADEPPSWREFDVESANKKFVAKVTVKDKNGKKFPYEWSYSLAVYPKGERAPLWSGKFGHRGDPGGFLADDGKTFADVGYWYYDFPGQVAIYREGKLVRSFAGKDFALDKTKLKKTASHLLWWAEEKQPSFDANDLVIPTIDGKIFRIDAKTLKLNQDGAKRFLPLRSLTLPARQLTCSQRSQWFGSASPDMS